MSSVREILEKTLEHLGGGQHWIKGHYRAGTMGNHHHCVLGAMLCVSGNTVVHYRNKEGRAAREALELAAFEEFGMKGPVALNDKRSTTFSDIERLVKRAMDYPEEDLYE